jgi:hypothetical protein
VSHGRIGYINQKLILHGTIFFSSRLSILQKIIILSKLSAIPSGFGIAASINTILLTATEISGAEQQNSAPPSTISRGVDQGRSI